MSSGESQSRHRFPRFLPCTLVLGLLLLLTGCETVPDRYSLPRTGDPVVDGKVQLQYAPAKDKVMWNYRVAASALRRNQPDEARVQLDTALPLVGGILANGADAKKARRLFSGEDSKIFIGEPYERVMAFYYRAILYWQDGQADNARACYRTGQFIDSDAEADTYKGDYILLDYLEGFITAKLAGDGSDALARARKNSKLRLPDYDTEANLIVFGEFGDGPRKYAGGEYSEQLRFRTFNSTTSFARLSIGDTVVAIQTYDDLNFQATTRGGRVMDHILGRKAVFKSATDSIGDVALMGGVVAASQINRWDGRKSHNAENLALALGAVGLISKLASKATVTEADTRDWNNLPQRLAWGCARVAPGDYSAKLEFFDTQGRLLGIKTRMIPVTVKADGDTVLFVSELTR